MSDPETPARIGLLGRGTVGGAFHDLLAERASAVAAASGRRPEITGVLRRSEGDFEQILAGSDLIVELIGGVEPAREYVLAALAAGKPVVTANKQLVAQHGDELFDAARDAGVQLRFEAAVAGAVPVIRMVQEGLGAIALDRISGIVNGTTNFILSEMASTGADYADALARAQELGYAEADPTDDVGGADAAAKMAILARLAFHTPVSLEDVSYEGITEIRPADIAYARDLGLSLKLLGIAERHGEGISVRVFPCFLYRGHPLAPIEGSFNAVTVEAPAITEITISGPGAGGHRNRLGGPLRRRLDPRRRGPGAPAGQAARGQLRPRLLLLPAPRGRRPARRAGHDRRRPRPQRDLGQERRSGRQRPGRPPRDGHPPRPGGELLRLARGDLGDSSSCAPRRVRSASSRRSTSEAGGWRLEVGSMAGLIERYRRYLPIDEGAPVVTLDEGSTPLLHAPVLSERAGLEVYLKIEGANPTGSFKDRGMTVAVSRAVAEGAEAVICASTGNTAASAAAYAARAGLRGAVIVPEGKIAIGKLAQALMHGARVVALRGNFDDALRIVRQLADRHPIELVNSVNPFRIEGQKTAAFEVVDELGKAPDALCIPVGNAGNVTAWRKGFGEYGSTVPALFGFQAEGAAPLVLGHPVADPETVASAIRIGNPARWEEAMDAVTSTRGRIAAVSDEQILSAYRLLASGEGVFCEPASAASVAGLLAHGLPGRGRRPAARERRLRAHRPRAQGSGHRARQGSGGDRLRGRLRRRRADRLR